MKTFLLLLALVGPWGFQEALLYLSGASCVEELSEDEVARYQSLAARPVDLNTAGRSRLLASGLLTPFQVASLLDYRQRTGVVLSWTELGLVDGFSEELCRALQVFCTLGAVAGEAPGRREETRVRESVVVRGGVAAGLGSASGSASGSAGSAAGLVFGRPAAVGGLKYEAAFGERAALFYSILFGQPILRPPPAGALSAPPGTAGACSGRLLSGISRRASGRGWCNGAGSR